MTARLISIFFILFSMTTLAQEKARQGILNVAANNAAMAGQYEGTLTQAQAKYKLQLDLKEGKNGLEGTSRIDTIPPEAYGIFKIKGSVMEGELRLEESDLTKHAGPFAWYRKKLTLKKQGDNGLSGVWNEADSNADHGTLELTKK